MPTPSTVSKPGGGKAPVGSMRTATPHCIPCRQFRLRAYVVAYPARASARGRNRLHTMQRGTRQGVRACISCREVRTVAYKLAYHAETYARGRTSSHTM